MHTTATAANCPPEQIIALAENSIPSLTQGATRPVLTQGAARGATSADFSDTLLLCAGAQLSERSGRGDIGRCARHTLLNDALLSHMTRTEIASMGCGSVATLIFEGHFHLGAVDANPAILELHVQLSDFSDAQVTQGLRRPFPRTRCWSQPARSPCRHSQPRRSPFAQGGHSRAVLAKRQVFPHCTASFLRLSNVRGSRRGFSVS